MAALVTTASGCKGYQLRGTVIAGAASAVEIVDADDPRLAQVGIGGARLEIEIDPDKLSRKSAGQTTSAPSGRFQLPIGEPGAGLLEYEVRAVARATGYQPATRVFRLPAQRKRLLIVLTPGRDQYYPEKSDILDETLEMSRPYLNE